MKITAKEIIDSIFHKAPPPEGCTMGRTGKGLCHLTTPGGYQYIEQNPAKHTKYGELAISGYEIVWCFCPNGKYHGGGIFDGIWHNNLNKELSERNMTEPR